MLHFCLGRTREHEEFLGREIHHGACQYASAARMMFETYRHEKTETGSENWYNFEMGLAFLDHTIEELRRLVRGLQPIPVEEGGLAQAIPLGHPPDTREAIGA